MPLVLLLEHDRQEDADAVDDAPQMGAEHPLPVCEGALPDGAAGAADAGVVADDVYGPKRLEGLLRELLHLLRLRDVGAHRQDRRAALPHLGVGLVEGALFDVREDDLHAFGGKAFGEAAADAAGRAGDDGYAVSKFFHASSLLITDD